MSGCRPGHHPAPPAGSDGPALVVFSGRADLRWLACLKPGFRHCFAALASGRHWVVYNPLSHCTDIAVLDGVGGDALAAWYRSHGFTVVCWTRRRPAAKPAPPGFYTCVEAVKRVLGIHAPRVITPWNLYNFLQKENF
jgi:hypothetical protein